MKNYNKILEAINRGIKFALDDFDDNEIQGLINNKVKYQGGMKEYIDLMNVAVGFDLPSGTLWCKYNLGVNPNLLFKDKDWYGKYYAWGELEGNKIDEDGDIYFGWTNYKFGSELGNLTKYCNNSEYGLNGFTDNLTELLPEDDVVYQNKKLHNFKFHIPTKELCEELINYTKSYWVNNYNPNKIKHNSLDDGGILGLQGQVFEGKNGNQLFIPAAGYYGSSDNYTVGSYCNLWTSYLDLDTAKFAYYLHCSSKNIGIYSFYRRYGFPIRPVLNL